MSEPKVILCFGDSITWGLEPVTRTRLPFKKRWPGLLEQALDGRARIIEEALCDRTTVWEDPFHDGRNGRAALGMLLESHAPIDLLIIMLGTNDLQRQYHNDAEAVAMGCEALLELAVNRVWSPDGGPGEILLIAPPHFGPFAPLEEICFSGKETEAIRLGDLFRSVANVASCHFLNAAEFAKPGQPDGIHFDSNGHEALARAVAANCEAILFKDEG